MDATVSTEPKKRGRPRKVVSEEVSTSAAGECKKSAGVGVRKASTKTATAAGKKDDAMVKKGVKVASKAVKAVKAAPNAKTTRAPVTEEKTTDGRMEVGKGEGKSKILEEVYKTGTMKPPVEPAMAEVVLPTGGAANVVMEQPLPTPTQSTPSPSSVPPRQPAVGEIVLPTGGAANVIMEQPLPTPTPSPSSQPRAPPPPRPASKPITKPTPSLPKRSTTIPLPTRPLNPSLPASPRPKPPSPSALENAATERAIAEGRMPKKYQGAARRVTAIMVGIPVILVVGWELWGRWDAQIRVKFEERGE
ncbi:hypothetical protein BU23DRAFT_116323 [Bimuria novae-zelandiae CBS 107.79]|uniref:Uncharacterized protein n=1 Tax=Bimuria novae-zelandiae CBS 107.79 TaxID=1447943 RepID=A0A6A5VC41_9PLEO|nr:hypothetical protein BU23DRAFT_116323 [Bimuria novae-zelandiae CBS 107.79]